MTRTATFIRRGVVVTVIVLIAGYALFRMSDLIAGPLIAVEHPTSGSAHEEPLIALSGTVHNATRIMLNDRDIVIDEEGRFSESLLLVPGYNIIELYAEDRFGRHAITHLELIHE